MLTIHNEIEYLYKAVELGVNGYVLKDDIFKLVAEDKDNVLLSELKRKIIIVDRNLPIPKLFEKFIESKEHIALIVDEFGAVHGIVTMEDVIETLLGMEILDEQDQHADLQKLARKRWEERAEKYGLFNKD